MTRSNVEERPMAPLSTVILGADALLQSEDGSTSVRLTAKEASIVLAIAYRRGGVLTKQALLTELYQGRDEPQVKIVDVFVCKARKKLAHVGSPLAIETVWGQGYRWHNEVRLMLPDSDHVSMEVSKELGIRLEDLALATDRSVSQVLRSIVDEHLDEHERRAWA